MISLEDFWFRYPESGYVFRGVTMEFKKGVTEIYGGSFSGKTTFCFILSGIAPEYTGGAVKGRIESDGIPVILFQDAENQIIGRTPIEDLSLSTPDPWYYLKKFWLEDLAERDVNTLSGGEMKRLALASLFSQSTESSDVVMDEPLSGLDMENKKRMISFISALAREQCVVVTDRCANGEGFLIRNGTIIKASRKEMLDEGVRVKNWLEKRNISRKTARDEVLLKIRDVVFGYDEILLDRVNLKIYSGEIVALTGPNGSGKSTLAKLMCGLERPQEGNIEGDAVMVFQNPSLNLLSTDDLHPELKTLLNIRKENIFRMNRREKMRAGIARVMALNSPVKIIDEADSILDARELKILLDIMRRECESGTSFIIVTHDPYIAGICDREIRILDGEVEVIEK